MAAPFDGGGLWWFGVLWFALFLCVRRHGGLFRSGFGTSRGCSGFRDRSLGFIQMFGIVSLEHGFDASIGSGYGMFCGFGGYVCHELVLMGGLFVL